MPAWNAIPSRQTAAASLDARIAALALIQHGVVALVQLIALGLSARGVQHRAARGALHRIHRGVYAVGHACISADGYRMAAVLACWPVGALSVRSAGELWEIRGSAASQHDVTIPSGRRRSTAAIRVHIAPLDVADWTTVSGIPVTTPARTLLDLAAVLSPDALERALNEAEVRRLDVSRLPAMLEQANGRRGTGVLRRLLAERSWAGDTRSALEDRFLELCRAHGLPRPRTNRRVEGLEVDAAWPAARVAVELDGAAVHGTRRAFHTDRRRDAMLAAAGWVVVRLTWERVTREPAVVAAELRATLVARAA